MGIFRNVQTGKSPQNAQPRGFRCNAFAYTVGMKVDRIQDRGRDFDCHRQGGYLISRQR
jgi:hypothetical protein